MKKLDGNAFLFLLIGLIICAAVAVGLCVELMNVEITAEQLEMIKEQSDGLSEDQIDMIVKYTIATIQGIALIVLAFIGYFIFRTIKNKNQEQGQGYITFLVVTSIIFGLFGLCATTGADPIGIGMLVGNVLVLWGALAQKRA